jgi:hypothetical protein
MNKRAQATKVRSVYVTLIIHDATVPENISTWEWLFEPGEFSPLYKTPREPLAGYVNAITKERLDWAAVKTKATQLSTALVKEYGLQPGDTVSLFSTNTIWYPVAMWAVIRAGMEFLTLPNFGRLTLRVHGKKGFPTNQPGA